MDFVIGSMNEAKVKAAKQVILEHFPSAKIYKTNADSTISAQPVGDEETLKGAICRAKNAQINYENAIGIGLEGGVRYVNDDMYICNWGALSLVNGRCITAGGAQIRLPNEIAVEIKKGKELGPVIDDYFKLKNVRQKEGAMGMFTAGEITRVDLFSHILKLLIGQYQYELKQNETASN